MSDLILVEGQACLDYIDKPIAFANISRSGQPTIDNAYATDRQNALTARGSANHFCINGFFNSGVTVLKFNHNTNKRIVGLVTKEYDNGGFQVVILGNEELNPKTNKNTDIIAQEFWYSSRMGYRDIITEDDTHIAERLDITENNPVAFSTYPAYEPKRYASENQETLCDLLRYDITGEGIDVGFDSALDYTPFLNTTTDAWKSLGSSVWEYQGTSTLTRPLSSYTITNDVNNTLVFGVGKDYETAVLTEIESNPLTLLSGALYNFFIDLNINFISLCPNKFLDASLLGVYSNTHGRLVSNFNFLSTPFNLILTRNKDFALEYLNNGTLPPDAFLFPLDWDNLPRYDEPIPTGDQPDDYPDDNNPDDDERDFDPTPNETPTFTVNQLTNYNWYWLTVPQWHDFIKWFWNDIGNYSDFDDIIAKVKGLYNDVASAVIMCRYYPVDISWIGGLGAQSNIKLGMIEKAGAYDTISQVNALRSVDIGHIHISQKYKSFMDMSPYSQLSLYLPWHGFIDLDMNLFNGHDVYVKALYDYLSGTIQYYIFYDNEVLVNTILCKMAMDIPITLQTKNDRDSAIFNNVSSTIGGLVGAGAGITSGNPIGMTLGITQGVGAFNSANASAPMRLMGNVGESGAFIGCQNCFVVVRRPTIQASDGKKNNTDVDTSIDRLTTWKKNVGMLCGYGYTLSSLTGKGFTVCHTPRIDFTNTAPLQSEVDEIYNYLEKGVIL